ncbi:hypothetical protein [Bacillus sp. FSL K6-3431]|uniref:hypothetical protein n=1 Tax=Bacillus sp. FSL K6-3431 TaxID=2921500 RepID=UPI0030F89E41
MKNQDEKLYEKLKGFHVDVPEFPIRKSRIERLANWLFEEVPFPTTNFKLTRKGMVLMQLLPIFITIASILPLFFL